MVDGVNSIVRPCVRAESDVMVYHESSTKPLRHRSLTFEEDLILSVGKVICNSRRNWRDVIKNVLESGLDQGVRMQV